MKSEKQIKPMNELAKEIHQNAVKHGFYDTKREVGTLLMLCVSELAEALEADRKGKHAILIDAIDEDNFKEDFETCIKDSFEDEIADTIIRIFDLCGYYNIDIDEHIRLKMKYNQMRENMHGKNY